MPPSPLARLLRESVLRQLDYRVAIAFSGGLDSATLATIAKENVETHLICVAYKDSHDWKAASESAWALGLPVQKIELDEARVLDAYQACRSIRPGTLMEMELMACAYEVCQAAKTGGFSVVLFGSGAEEVFIGYNRHYLAHETGEDLHALLKEEIRTLPMRDLMRTREVASHFGMEARFPFLDEALVRAVFEIEIGEKMGTAEMKKPLLRKLAAELGVPKCARLRPKKAMQYGSDIHRAMLRLGRQGKLAGLNAGRP